MALLTHIKTVDKITPSNLDIAMAAITGGSTIHEYDANTNYVEGTYVYRIVNNEIVVYKAAVDVTGTGTFNIDEWIVVHGLGGSSGIIISETPPESEDIDCWFKPLKYESHDVESIAMQIDPYYITYKYKMTTSSTLWDYINLPVTATPENTVAIAFSFVNNPLIAGIRSLPTCSNGYPVATIQANLFKDNTTITGFTTDSIKTIESSAFQGCTSLTTATFTDNIVTIGANAFNGSALTTVVFPESLATISANAFANCSSLTTATFYNSDTVINDAAFTGTTLTSITGYSGSTANSYATENNITFIELS